MVLTFFVQLLTDLFAWLERIYLDSTRLPQTAPALGSVLDLTRSKPELLLENALLRQQLIILQRHVKKPHLTRTDRLSLLLLASRPPFWKHALLIFSPDTLLRWHRQGFRLFWRLKSRARPGRPPLRQDWVTMIQRLIGRPLGQMATENPSWGAARIRGELLKLGIHVAKDTIPTYLYRVRPPRSPSQDWNTFLKNHAKEIWPVTFCR